MNRFRAPALTLLLAVVVIACPAPEENHTVDREARGELPTSNGKSGWPGWGGPNGDFRIEVSGIADEWPVAGPPVLWSRALGEGSNEKPYASIVEVDGLLVTMYREGEEDVVVGLRADDGSTVWEYRYVAPTRSTNVTQFGRGPNASPLIAGDRVITLGYTGILHALDRRTGEAAWTVDLIDDLDGSVLQFGNAAAPILHDGKIVVLVGGDHGAVALDPEDGSVAWAGPPTSISYATPIVIDVDGRTQLVYFGADAIYGLDPATGEMLWDRAVVNEYRNHASSPVRGPDDLLFVPSQLDGGTRVLRLAHDGTDATVEQVWESGKMSIHYWNAVRVGDHIYASIGGNGSILACIDPRTGEFRWRRRGFSQANLVHLGDRTLLLDQKGELALVELSPEGLTIVSQTRLIDDAVTWTPPTVVGTTAYIRDTRTIRAVDLSATDEAPETAPN